VEQVAACCLELIEGGTELPGAISAIAYQALMALYDDVMVRPQPAAAHDKDRMARIVEHIRSHLSQPLDATTLAAMVGLSRTQFTRVFTSHEGLPPAEFIMRERMTQAARILARPDVHVGEAARLCGFQDPNYFAKVFRRTFGISPTEFRTTGMYAAAGRREHRASRAHRSIGA
jgi:AraC-like DNA-binding protein